MMFPCFPVLHFSPLRFGPSFSSPAFSILAFSAFPFEAPEDVTLEMLSCRAALSGYTSL